MKNQIFQLRFPFFWRRLFFVFLYNNKPSHLYNLASIQMELENHIEKQLICEPANYNGIQSQECFYNILHPSHKIQCDVCKRDISKATKIDIYPLSYCPACFANQQPFSFDYNVINKLDFPLFEHEWTAIQDLLLFQGLEKHGFGNWDDISDFIGTNKSREEVEQHYQTIYLQGENFLPTKDILSYRNAEGQLIQAVQESIQIKTISQQRRTNKASAVHNIRAALTVVQTVKTGSSPAQIIGYMPKRGDFEVQYDNDAQLLLAEMQFQQQDGEQEKSMKFRLIDIYNQKLNERIKRKEFVITHNLLDLRQQNRLDKGRTKEQRDLYNTMKVFAKFNSAQLHQDLIRGILKQKQIRQKIEELKEFKKKGFKTLEEVQTQLENKKKKQQKTKKKEIEIQGGQKATRRTMRKDIAPEKVSQKRILLLNHQQEQLCKQLNLPFKQYSLIKETLLKENVRLAFMHRNQIYNLVNCEATIVQAIFDLLLAQEELLEKEIETSSLASSA